MRKVYTKPSSYTQQEAKSLYTAKCMVLMLGRLSIERHQDLMFEYGCRFVETNIIFPTDQLKILTISKYNFWLWWRIKWAKDDEGLIEHKAFEDHISYPEMKAYMLTSPLLKDQLINMLLHD
jgi:hypothetical protein